MDGGCGSVARPTALDCKLRCGLSYLMATALFGVNAKTRLLSSIAAGLLLSRYDQRKPEPRKMPARGGPRWMQRLTQSR